MLTMKPADLTLTNTRQLERGDFFLLDKSLCRVIEKDDRQTTWVRLLAEKPFTLRNDHDRNGFRGTTRAVKLNLENAQFRLHVDRDSLELTSDPQVGSLVVEDGRTSILVTWNEDGSDDRFWNAIRIDSNWERVQIEGGRQFSFTGWTMEYSIAEGEWQLLAFHEKATTQP